MNVNNIGIIGLGYVGLTTAAALSEIGHNVIINDADKAKLNSLKAAKLPIYEPGLDELFKANLERGRIKFADTLEKLVNSSEAVFICVGTPFDEQSGALTMIYVEQVARGIAKYIDKSKFMVIVDKSTVPVQTASKVEETIKRYSKDNVRFAVVSNPEFLQEGRAVELSLNPDRIVIGSKSEKASSIMEEIYKPLIDKTGCPFIVMKPESAELVKYAANGFLAMKLSFINLVARVCEQIGANVEEVVRGMGYDERIGFHFLRAGIGYGGSCFPKDVPAFVQMSKELGVEFSLLEDTHRINEEQTCWFFKKIERELWILKDKKIAVWGLAFKSDTDDIRESPAIKLVKMLASAGVSLAVHDFKAMDNAKAELRSIKDIEYYDSPLRCCENADSLIVGTEWKQYDDVDVAEVFSMMHLPFVFDGKNVLTPEKWTNAGFKYFGVGK